MDHPGGPSSHCLTSSGFVKASKTRRRGALNVARHHDLAVTLRRHFQSFQDSPLVISFNVLDVPVSFLWALLSVQRLSCIEQGVEALVVGVPDAAVFFEPFGGVCEGLGFEAAGAALGIAAAGD